MSKLLEVLTPLKSFARTITFRKYKPPGGVRYPGGILYYPRFPNEKDPEITPSKLFLVIRTKPVKGTQWWLRHILRIIHLDLEDQKVTIVKNIPEMNAMLWKVKHLVKIVPIVCPYGEPTEEDINYTRLLNNGTCLVTKSLTPDQKAIEAWDAFDKDVTKMDTVTIRRDCRMKWMNPWGGGFN